MMHDQTITTLIRINNLANGEICFLRDIREIIPYLQKVYSSGEIEYSFMSVDIHAMHDKNFAAMSLAMRQEACDFLRQEFPDNFFEQIKLGYVLYQKEWWQQKESFFTFNGDSIIQNALRKAGFSDHYLPCETWDDAFIPVLEAAAGIRPLELSNEID